MSFDFAAWIEASKMATEGPWITRYDCDFYNGGFYLHSGLDDVCRFQEDENDPNMAFIAQSRMAPDAVLDLVRESRYLFAYLANYAISTSTREHAARMLAKTAWAEKREGEDEGQVAEGEAGMVRHRRLHGPRRHKAAVESKQ